MSDQSLREALENLRQYCGKVVDDPTASEDDQVAYDDIYIQISGLLAAHPAEPATPSQQLSAASVAAYQAHQAELSDAAAPVQVAITDAVPDTVTLAAVRAFHKRPGYSELERMRDALEAAAPLLGSRPLLDREAVKRILGDVRALPVTRSTNPHVEAVMELARPMPTREQIAEALHDHWASAHTWRQGCRESVCIEIFLDRADAVLALLNGAKS